ncbi:MAG TPA: hypothetical protein VKQ28_03730 [Candidatus Acidoferrum sp.]|nr:hypothetical protein [Candidatus Acidoferrum sp.]
MAAPSQRFKPDVPQIPGLPEQGAGSQAGFRPMRFIGFAASLIFGLLVVRWLMLPTTRPAPPATTPPQIEVPAPASDPNAAMPLATPSEPQIASVDEMALWAAKDFLYKNRVSGEDVPALLIRLPTGTVGQSGSYWAFSLNAPFDNCHLEYVQDLHKLREDYGFRAAKHPMVGNPCSRTVYDPLKLMKLPGDIWVRGAIVQGSDSRPPLGIEVEIRDRQILAARME